MRSKVITGFLETEAARRLRLSGCLSGLSGGCAFQRGGQSNQPQRQERSKEREHLEKDLLKTLRSVMRLGGGGGGGRSQRKAPGRSVGTRTGNRVPLTQGPARGCLLKWCTSGGPCAHLVPVLPQRDTPV